MVAQFIKNHGYLGIRTAFKLCSIPLSFAKTPRAHSDNAVLPGFYIVFIYSIKLKGELIKDGGLLLTLSAFTSLIAYAQLGVIRVKKNKSLKMRLKKQLYFVQEPRGD